MKGRRVRTVSQYLSKSGGDRFAFTSESQAFGAACAAFAGAALKGGSWEGDDASRTEGAGEGGPRLRAFVASFLPVPVTGAPAAFSPVVSGLQGEVPA